MGRRGVQPPPRGAKPRGGSYKQLKEVERAWRDQKHILDLRPNYHRKQDRIRAHVLLSETRARDTWRNLSRELERIHLGYFHGSAGRALQRTETTLRSARSSPRSSSPNLHGSSRSSPPERA